jgi:hypothetical protein
MVKRTPSKKKDLATLSTIADEIDQLKDAYDRRRVIWKRRLDAGDTKQVELAEASRVKLMQIRLGTQDKYFDR